MTATDDHTFRFRPAARLQRYLGRELIGDPNVAIIEFVKNSYDAGASRVIIDFTLDADPARLQITDDGTGMNAQEFENNWMHPGFSDKGEKLDVERPPKNASPALQRQAQRIPVGEKGIGRLAAGRLGNHLEVFTRKAKNRPWLHVEFHWDDFDDMHQPLDEVPIRYDFEAAPEDPPFPTGTILVISDLSIRWEERIRGRAVRGRRRTRLGRLKQDLEFLVRPLETRADDFEISLDSDKIREPDDIGRITPAVAAEAAEYSFAFRFAEHDGSVFIERTVHRSPEAATESGRPRQEVLPPVEIDEQVAKEEDRPEHLASGPFEGRFLYNPPPAMRRAKEINETPVGVLLYRDGLLVEPYGLHDDDWLGVRARKAQRQGHAAIQPDTFSGHVAIAKKSNRELRDQTNRLGLLESPHSENFLEHVRAEFRIFEDLVYKEVLEPRWKDHRSAEAGERAQESQERTRLFLRSLAHSLRQPLMGLGWELVSLEAIGKRDDVPPPVKAELSQIGGRIEDRVKLAERLIERVLTIETPEFAEVTAGDLVKQALAQTRFIASRHGVDVDVQTDLPKRRALVPPELVVQALAALIGNAIEAPRSDGDEAKVVIEGTEVNGDILLAIEDNGLGIEDATPETALGTIESTKGRPAFGLQNAELSLIAARGRLTLAETGQDGTRFEVALPTRVAGLRG